MLSAGEKTEYITIKRDAISRDSDGSEIRTPAVLASRWAQIVPVSGREFWAAQQTQSTVQYRVRLDLMDGIKQSDYLTWGARTLQIVAAMHNRAAFETTLMCAERNA
jgi:SPP1 family predicted phage head-tail adaptor